MSIDERVLRLENGFSTLAQLTAKSESRTSDLEKHFQMLVELARVQSERLDEANERQDTLENNLTALSQIVVELAHAQRRTETALATLTEHVDRLAEKIDKLADVVGQE